jgi:tetratricopeptide (TPR) repeat protein
VSYVEAWNNPGNVLAEMGRHNLAVSALRKALAIEPDYADAHYSLAEVLDEIGEHAAARPHWEAYLREEPVGEWADYARNKLADGARITRRRTTP